MAALADQAAIALRNARLYEMELREASRERDETLEALRESNEKISRILESITDLFYSLDSEWRFVEINRKHPVPVWQEQRGINREGNLGGLSVRH